MDGDVIVLYRVVSRGRPRLRRRARRASPRSAGRRSNYVVGDHASARGARPALAGPPEGARPRHRGAGRVHLRPDRDDRRDRPEPAPRQRAATITCTSSGSPCKLFGAVLHKSLIAVFCSAVLFVWTGDAFALVRSAKAPTTIKKKVVSNITVTGPVREVPPVGLHAGPAEGREDRGHERRGQAEGVDQDHRRQLADLPGSHAEVEVHQRAGDAAPPAGDDAAAGLLGLEAR